MLKWWEAKAGARTGRQSEEGDGKMAETLIGVCSCSVQTGDGKRPNIRVTTLDWFLSDSDSSNQDNHTHP